MLVAHDPGPRLPQTTAQRSQADPHNPGRQHLTTRLPLRQARRLPLSSRIGLPRQCHTSPTTRHATRSRDPSDPALGAGSGRTHAVLLGALPGQCVIDQGTRDLIYWPAVLLSRLLASPDSMPTYGMATVARSSVASHPGPLPPARTHQATAPQHAHVLKRQQCHTSPWARPSVHVQCDNVRGAPAGPLTAPCGRAGAPSHEARPVSVQWQPRRRRCSQHRRCDLLPDVMTLQCARPGAVVRALPHNRWGWGRHGSRSYTRMGVEKAGPLGGKTRLRVPQLLGERAGIRFCARASVRHRPASACALGGGVGCAGFDVSSP